MIFGHCHSLSSTVHMAALAVFTSATGSHPFLERRVVLSEPAKIGRSVAQAKPSPTNSIFDCKVLSRNHAMLWYENGMFYLQDTKSSNGTFVNSSRLSKGSEESPATEICSGDIIQFGVDVMENSRKVTHNCIIAAVQLFHPTGQEAKNSVTSSEVVSHRLQPQELYQLAQCLQEATHREEVLESKLTALQRQLQSTQDATECNWQALVDEDRLLSRLECLEDQLSIFVKGQTEDGLRQHLMKLLSDKARYEAAAKDSMRRFLEEKLEAVRKVSDLESSLSNAEEEVKHQQEMCSRLHTELTAVAEKCEQQSTEFEELSEKLRDTENKHDTERSELQEKNTQLRTRLEESVAQVEMLHADNVFVNEQMANCKAMLECLKKTDSPKISECISRGVQVELVNLLDLQLLSNGDSPEKSDENNGNDWRTGDTEKSIDTHPFITIVSSDEVQRDSRESESADELSSCMSQLEDTHVLVDRLRDEIRNVETDKAILTAKIQALEEELQNSEHEKSCQAAKIQTLEGQIKALWEELSAVQPQSMHESSDMLVGSVSGMHSTFGQESSPSQDEIMQLKRECAELRQRVHDVEIQMQISRQENDELKVQYQLLKASYQELEQIRDSLQENENLHHSNLTDAQKELDLSKSELSAVQSELNELKAQHHDEVSSLRDELDDTVEEFSTLSYNSRVLSYCATVPIALLIFVIAIAFHPLLSVLTVTSSPT